MSYKGRYRLKNADKYKGDPDNLIYRSLWELQCMKWCDHNPNVRYFSSEEIVVPYVNQVDKRYHRYYPDLMIEFVSGETLLVEIKPASQTRVPNRPSGRKTRRFVSESLTYVKNQSKWQAAEEYAKKRGWTFRIWTEHDLKALGIRVIS